MEQFVSNKKLSNKIEHILNDSIRETLQINSLGKPITNPYLFRSENNLEAISEYNYNDPETNSNK